MKKRTNWIDILKDFGILTVILGHCYIPEEFTKKSNSNLIFVNFY